MREIIGFLVLAVMVSAMYIEVNHCIFVKFRYSIYIIISLTSLGNIGIGNLLMLGKTLLGRTEYISVGIHSGQKHLNVM